MTKRIQTWLCIMLAFCGQASAQQITADNRPLTEVLQQVQQQTKYRFYWIASETAGINVNVDTDAKDIHQLMKALLAGTDLKYTIHDGQMVFLLKNKILMEIPPLFAQEKGSTIEGQQELLLSGKEKATSANKIYVVGKTGNSSSQKMVELTGTITSFKTGEPVTGVNMVVKNPTWSAAVSDANGRYVLKVPQGEVDIEMTGIGVIDTHRRLMVYESGILDIELEDKMQTLEEVTVTANKVENVKGVQMGVQALAVEDLKTIPTAFGELDVIKVVQALPGVKTMGEASSGLNVRGGSTDQNLILWNEGTIYNPTHLFGFFSAFNGSIVQDMELYKGSIPAKYGGRISSVLEINSRRGNKEKYQGEISLGLLTSSLALEGPIKKGKTSLLLAGRTTYSDWLLNLLPEKSRYKNGKAGFYDLNLLLSHQFSQKDNLYISGYYSHDRFNFLENEKYEYANANASLQWAHLFNDNFRMTTTAGYDHYDYATKSWQDEHNAYKMGYDINQYYLKMDFNHSQLEKHRIDWGLNAIMYDINPGKVQPHGSASLYIPKTLQKEKALEAALYLNEEWEITPQLTANIGARYSLFNAFGKRTFNTYKDGELPSILNITGTESRNGNLKTYHAPEFRLGLRYAFTDNFSVKAGFNTMQQYIHKVSNTMTMSPTDTWKLSDMFIEPQKGIQYSLGFYKNLMDDQLEASIEGYYKTMDNYLDYRSGAQLLMNDHLETEVLPTEGRAYGVEFMLKRPKGKFNGWFSYTYSKTELRQSDARIARPANKGEWYPAEYDKPHDIKLVGNYQITQRYSASLNVDYSTGRPQTMPVSQYYSNTIGATSFVFSERNGVRIPDYFRMDLSFNIKPTHRLNAKAYTFFTIGVYNLTGRKNVYSIYFKNEGEEGMKGYRMSIFGAPIPYASFNVKF
ncbi:MAG: TonB-dependent receptor [Bacteroides sp.]|nr:TonB-dependent receptor [Bacteroides sp.]